MIYWSQRHCLCKNDSLHDLYDRAESIISIKEVSEIPLLFVFKIKFLKHTIYNTLVYSLLADPPGKTRNSKKIVRNAKKL